MDSHANVFDALNVLVLSHAQFEAIGEIWYGSELPMLATPWVAQIPGRLFMECLSHQMARELLITRINQTLRLLIHQGHY